MDGGILSGPLALWLSRRFKWDTMVAADTGLNSVRDGSGIGPVVERGEGVLSGLCSC